MSFEQTSVITASEAEAYADALKAFEITEIGSQKWTIQHEYLEKMNMQAVLNASVLGEEYVKEYLVNHDKISVLITELLSTEIWKQMIFPEFIDQDLEQTVMFPIYMVLYHEVTVANLLETVMFHQDACEAAEDAILDLIDYCYRKLSVFTHDQPYITGAEVEFTSGISEAVAGSSLKELQKQKQLLDFAIATKTVSIIRYITDHLESLSLSASTRVMNTLDFPHLLVQLVDSHPWTKETNGLLKKYEDGKWQIIPHQDRFKLSKIEGQIWLTLFHVLMNESCQRKYELNSFRKNALLKLRPHLNEMLLDQLPILGELQRYLEQLSFMEPPQSKPELLLEQVPEVRENIIKRYEGKWSKIAATQSKTFFNPNNKDMKIQAQRLADTYNFDALENLLIEPPKCVLCGEEATKRCSRCQNEWYCRRECQVNHWKKHKKACDLMFEAMKKIEESEG